jgi:hypothetical protein
MAYAPTPYVEHPNLRVPIALIVDDPAPCINPLWYFRHQVDRQADPIFARDIPLDFMQVWCDWIRETGIRGDFTVLPYPAGLGRVDDHLEGYPADEMREWMALARQAVAPQFDIHCEILTHTNALDLDTLQLLPISEHEWTEAQDEETLTHYFATAMQILGEAGLPNHGLTQPCYYRGDESMYARAVLAAEKRINGRKVTHNFLHNDNTAHAVVPRLTYLDEAASEAVVSIWAGTDDFIWNSQEPDSQESAWTPEALADRFLTEDGKTGRLVTLLNGGGPVILITHWQSLYSNGSRLGLNSYREVIRRIQSHFAHQVEWRKISDIARHFLAAQTAQFTAQATPNRMEVAVTSPFDTDIFTFSVPTPWPLFTGPEVSVEGQPYTQVLDPTELAVGKWVMRGSVVTVSLPVHAATPTTVTVAPRSTR